MASNARILIAAPSSGGGKTTFTCGLLACLRRRGLALQACKCGPDYIDPMFHREVIGAQVRNLDLFLAGRDLVCEHLALGMQQADITVIEGVMGFYDGLAVSDEASAWDVARTTQTPVLLVVDGYARMRSIAAEVLGFLRFRDQSCIAGVIVNRISPSLFERYKEIIETECGVPVLGYMPKLEDASLSSRHLGLITAGEVEDLQAKLDSIADALEESLDLDGILELAASAPALPEASELPADKISEPVRIAIAKDDAFCFYYDDTLRLLERLGAELVEFSPLADVKLPDDIGGLYLGGGYPELHTSELAANTAMRESVATAVKAGLPTIAECGGFMYLHKELEDEDGIAHPMAGIIDGRSYKTPRLRRFGYITITAKRDNLLCAAGESMNAHEFHCWDSESCGDDFHAQKPQSTRGWDCITATDTLFAGYPHLYLHAYPDAARRFLEAAIACSRNEA